MDPSEPANYLALAKLYEDAGRYEDAEAQYSKAKEVKPNDPSVLAGWPASTTARASSTRRSPRSSRRPTLEPNNPEGYHRVAIFYWDKATRTSA